MGEKWRKENPEKHRAIVSAWKKRNSKKVKAYNKEYREKNRAKINAKGKIYNKAHPNHCTRNYALKQCYGMTTEEYNELFAKQQGKCAICGIHQTELKKTLHVDHCHKTEKIRGLLCSNCNTGIGLLQEDIENLQCAILYLNKQG